jgi:hypothetical protein
MLKVVLLALFCLLCPSARAQEEEPPEPRRVVEAERDLLRRLKRLTFTARLTVEELDARGRAAGSRSYSYRVYLRDDGRLAARDVLVSAVKLKHAYATRLDGAALARPLFTFGEPDFEGRDGDSYVFRTARPGLDGRVWTDARGRVLRAEGVRHISDPAPGERPLTFVWMMDPKTLLPRSAEGRETFRDKNGRGVTVRVRVEYSDFRAYVAPEPRVVEEGEPGEVPG